MGFLFKKKKVSKDGTKVDIIGYQEKENREWTVPQDSGVYLEEIQEHIERSFPCNEAKTFVFHEIVSDIVHIDVNVIPPEGARDYYVLWTSGMSDMPMSVPDGNYDKREYERAELVMFLPKDWKINETGTLDTQMEEEYYWPIFWIKYLARFPHEYHTWFGIGHTIPNGQDYDPLGKGTEMGGFFFMPCIPLGEQSPGVNKLICKDGATINFLWAIPMYKEEIEFKLEEGFEEMMELFTEVNFPRVIDPGRTNYKAR